MAGCGGGDSGDSGGNNDQVNGSDTTAPTIPANLTATAVSSSQIDLSWDASADDVGVTGYNIYRCAGSCTPTTFLTTSTTNSYSDTGLTAGTTYTYTVSAYDAAGNESGEPGGVSAATLADNVIYATSCEQADVQAAIDSAVDGDTVTVPAGECTWITSVQNTPSVSIAKSIVLRGAGIDLTVITDSTDNEWNGNEVGIYVTGVTGRTVRITGFTFTGTGDSKGVIHVVGPTDFFWKNMRIDHNKFTLSGVATLMSRAYGLIDNNIFDDPVRGLNNIIVSGIGIQNNSLSFSQPNPAGTDNAVYIEDNTFINPIDQNVVGDVDAYDGGHFVFRYNTVTNGGIQTHETAYTGLRGVRHYEIYNNTFTSNTTTNLARVMAIRGGTGVIHNNTISGNYNKCVMLLNYRTNATQDVAAHWGWCDNTNTCDGNDPSYANGYPCMDQIGRITDSGSGSAASCYQGGAGPGPTQVLDPLYAWNNKCLSDTYNASINVYDSCNLNGICMVDHIQADRDYYDQTQKPDYTPYPYPHPLTLASATGDVYYVSPSGTASWAECTDINTPCSLSTANVNATAGDVINLRGGTYNTGISPTNSGSSGNKITYQAYAGETPTLTDVGTWSPAIFLDGNDYIKIDGITVNNVYKWANIRNGAHYNEITNSVFTDDDGVATGKGFNLWGQCSGGSPYTCPSTNNWIHNNTFFRMGWVGAVDCQDIGGVMYIGTITVGDSTSNYNTIEDNVMYAGGHHILEINSKYNAIRNNVMHNEGWMTDPGNCDWGPSPRNGKYGNRNIQLFNQDSADRQFTLLENNRFGHAAFASDGGMDGNIVIASRANIVRYNYAYYSETIGIYFKDGSGPADAMDNKVYNNTVYSSGQDTIAYPDTWTGYGEQDWRRGVFLLKDILTGNVVKNNIIYNSFTADISCNATCQSNNTFTDNWVTADGDPLFINTDVSDPTSTTLPDLRVNSGSGVIDDGVNLTQANGSGTSSTTLIVDDALYFQDGSRGSSLSNIQADWIAIGTVSNTVQISSINYSTNTITLTSPMTWSDNASIWVYKDSAGRIVLRGSAPDVGAYEYVN